MNTTLVRLARMSDAESLASITVSSWKVAYKDIIPSNILDDMDATSLSKGWRAALIKSDKETLVAESCGDVVGYLRYSNKDSEDAIEITQFYLKPEDIGQGYGTMLLQYLNNKAKQSKVRQLTVKVVDKNQRANAFYKNAGFIRSGIIENDRSVKNIPVTLICYRLLLAEISQKEELTHH